MAGEIYAALIPPTGTTYIPGHAGRASQIEQIRQNLVILGKPRYWHLGSASTVGHLNTAYAWAEDANTVKFCQEDVRGLTLTLRVWVKTANVSGFVRVRFQNTDDAVTLAELPAGVVDVAWTLYEIAITPPAGTTRKSYRIEIVAGLNTVPVYYRGAQMELKL